MIPRVYSILVPSVFSIYHKEKLLISRLLRSRFACGHWYESRDYVCDDWAQEKLHPYKEEAEVVANGAHHGVDVISEVSLEEVSTKLTVGFVVTDDGLNGASSPEFFFDLSVDAAFLSGFEDPVRPRHVVATVALVDIDALDLAPGEGLGLLDDPLQGVAVEGIPGERGGVEDELATLATLVGRGDRDLDAELVGLGSLAFGGAFDFGGVPGVELPAALTLLLAADPAGLDEGAGEDRLEDRIAIDLACDVTGQAAEPGAEELQLPVHPLELFGVRIAPGHPSLPAWRPGHRTGGGLRRWSWPARRAW